MKVLISVQYYTGGKWFGIREVYKTTGMVDVPVLCTKCTGYIIEHCYVIPVDGVNYNIPEDYATPVPDDYKTDNSGGNPVVDAVEAFVKRYNIPYPGMEPIKDMQKAYYDYLGIDVLDDLLHKDVVDCNPNPGEKDG